MGTLISLALSKIGGFILGKPKMAAFIAIGIVGAGFAAHYLYMEHKIVRLETEKAAISSALKVAQDLARDKDTALKNERKAVVITTQERDAARRALDVFRAGRENDTEAQAWAAQPVPPGEQNRYCEALPEMEGCQTTPPQN